MISAATSLLQASVSLVWVTLASYLASLTPLWPCKSAEQPEWALALGKSVGSRKSIPAAYYCPGPCPMGSSPPPSPSCSSAALFTVVRPLWVFFCFSNRPTCARPRASAHADRAPWPTLPWAPGVAASSACRSQLRCHRLSETSWPTSTLQAPEPVHILIALRTVEWLLGTCVCSFICLSPHSFADFRTAEAVSVWLNPEHSAPSTEPARSECWADMC